MAASPSSAQYSADQPIEAESVGSDSDYESGVESDTTSLASTIYHYIYENGRRYHRFQEGTYVLPNDETEQDRLDIFHHIQLLLCKGKLHLAPLNNLHRVLDVGTGTGIWALDMAQTYPSAEVIGTDLSPIQPGFVYPNCKFEVDDAELEWTFDKDYFDFIYSRTIAQSLRNWPRYLKQMFVHTKPGGYIELVEATSELHSDDGTLLPTSALIHWQELFNKACVVAKMRVYDDKAISELVKEVEQTGFVDVVAHKLRQPWSPWPKDPHMKEVGKAMLIQGETALVSYGLALMTRYLGMTNEDAQKVCTDAYADMRNRRIHMYNFVFHIVGRKPEAE